MKKILFLLPSLLMVLWSTAQDIPNGGFKTFASGIPQSWTAVNSSFVGSSLGKVRVRINPNPTIVTGNDDSTSVYITAQNSGGVKPGVLVSGINNGASADPSGIQGGFPATIRPAMLTGFAKYATANANHGEIRVIVSRWNGSSRDTIGSVSGGLFAVDESSDFINFNIPIAYNPTFNSLIPDSIQIVLMSSQSNETAALGDSLFVDLMRFSSCLVGPNITLGTRANFTPNVPGIAPGVSEFALANSDSREVSYTFTVAIPSPASSTFLGLPVTMDPLDSVKLNYISDLPEGFTVSCGYPNCVVYGNSVGCFTLSGTLPSDNDVEYMMIVQGIGYGYSSALLLGLGNGYLQDQGARPQDTITITVGSPAPVVPPVITLGPKLAPLPVRTTNSMAGGVKHALYVCNDGSVMSVGDNTHGQLGDGTNEHKSIAGQVNELTDIISVSGGLGHSLFLKSDGTVWACGANSFGQLGDGTQVAKNIPFQIPSLSGIISIDAGYDHSLFLKNDGTVYACGRNDMFLGGGQLGDGTTVDKSTPFQIPSLSDVTAISGGYNFSLFLKSDGTVWGGGANYAGQLGDGTTVQKTTPIQAIEMSDMRSVKAGFDHSVFLKKDGTAWACGLNVSGELADGTTIDRPTPFMITNISEVISVDAGSDHNVYLKSDGTAWGSGINGSGELGDGTGVERRTTSMALISDVKGIVAGDYFTLYNKSDGTVWATGVNNYLQLGDGTFVNKLAPVQVLNLCNVVTGIEEHSVSNDNNTVVYPNPSEGQFVFSTEEDVLNATLTITNLLGQTIYRGAFTNHMTIDLSKQHTGMYQYSIISADDIVATGKIIVQ